MNLLLLEEEDFLSATRVRVSGRRLLHLRGVLGVQPGARIRAGRIGGMVGQGVVVDLSPVTAELEVELSLPPPPPVPIRLVVALPRPKVFRRILVAAATFGVKHIFVIHAWHVERSYWSSPHLVATKIRDTLLLGLEQSSDTILPSVEMHPRFRPFAEDVLPGVVVGTRPLLGDPAATTPCPTGPGSPTTLAIGPERGFTTFESECFRSAGFSPVSLSPRTLRVDQAILAFLGRLA